MKLNPVILCLCASLAVACDPNTVVEQEATVGAFDPDRDNSPKHTELTFVAGMGLMDGTNCDTWPKDFRWDSPHPAGATSASPPLPAQLAQLSGLQEAHFLGQLLPRLDALGIHDATILGSKYGLDIRTVPDPSGLERIAAAVDHSTRTGYALSRRWLCTETMATQNRCTVHRVDMSTGSIANSDELQDSDLDPGSYAILVRTRPAVDLTQEILNQRILAVVTAPEVSVQAGVDLDGDVLIATDSFSSRGPFSVEPRVTDQESQSWEVAIGFEPKAAFFGVFAQTLHSLDVDLYAGGGLDFLQISDDLTQHTDPQRRTDAGSAAAFVNPNASVANGVPSPLSDLFQVSHQLLRPIPELTARSNFESHAAAGCDDKCSSRSYRAVETQVMETVVTINNAVPIRRASGPEAEVFVACYKGQACEHGRMDKDIRIHKPQPTQVDPLDIDRLVDRILTQSIDTDFRAPPVCAGYQQTADGLSCLHNSEGSCEWSLYHPDTGYTCTTAANCEQQIRAHPTRLNRCTQHDIVRVCVRSAATGNESCATHTGYNPSSPLARDRIRQELTEQLIRRFFTERSATAQDPRRVPLTNRSIGSPTLGLNQLITRGFHLELLVQARENESLRTGVLTETWDKLQEQLLTQIPPDPATGRSIDLDDRARVLELWSLRDSAVSRLQAKVQDAALSDDAGLSINALGQPYGAVGQGWKMQPLTSGQPGFFYDQLKDQWRDIANEIERLNEAIRYQNLQGGLQQHAEANFQLAKGLLEFSQERERQLQQQRASVARTAAQIGELLTSVQNARQSYVDGMAAIWQCDPALPASEAKSCFGVMNAQLQSLVQECVAQSTRNPLADLLNVLSVVSGHIGTILSTVDAVASAFNLVGSNIVLTITPDGNELVKDIAEFLKKTSEVVKKAKKGADSALKVSKFMADLMHGVNGASCRPSAPAYRTIQTHSTQINDMVTNLQNFSLEISELGSLLQRYSDDVRYYRANAREFAQLKRNLAPVVAHYDALRSQGGDGVNLVNACPLARAAVHASMIDVYRASSALITTTGGDFVPPHFSVPASPAYPEPLRQSISGWRENESSHGFLYSLWDTARFRSAVFNPQSSGSGGTAIVDQMISRFDEYKLREVCRVGMGTLENGLFLVSKRVDGPSLDAFLDRAGTGSSDRLRFEVTLDDLVSGAANMGPNINIAKTLETQSQQWADLSAPIVLGVAYEVERSQGGRQFSSPHGGWAGPGIAAPKTAYVPSLTCENDPVVSQERFDFQGAEVVVETCPKPVMLQSSASESLTSLNGMASDLLNDYRSSSHNSAPFCQLSSGALVPNSLQGRPLLGVWSLTQDRLRAAQVADELRRAPSGLASDPSWLSKNQDVTAVVVHFVVGIEVLENAAEPHYILRAP